MNKDHSYTLAELAEKTGLTDRTVRYYIEQVLPPHHKQGRGKLARYGEGTLNCIRFIVLVGERYGFKPGQAKGVLADVPQETIDRVVRGEEELAVMTVPSVHTKMSIERASSMPSSSARMAKHVTGDQHRMKASRVMEDRPDALLDAEMSGPNFEPEIDEMASYSVAERIDPWRPIFADEQVRIQCRGRHKLTSYQEEQIEIAARLIELALIAREGK